jgi:hypothetical protein
MYGWNFSEENMKLSWSAVKPYFAAVALLRFITLARLF